jgi:DNA-binding transcriptional LysR family regulator
MRSHPVLSDRNVALVDDQIDIAVRVGVLPDSSLVATRVGAVRQVVCASPAFIKQYGRPRAPADLGTLPCVTFDVLSGAAQWSFVRPRGGRVYSVSVLRRLSVNTAEAALDAAVEGVGLVRVLSYQCAPAIQRGELQLVLRPFEPSPLPVHLVHAGGPLLPLKSRSFLDFSAPRLRAALQGLPRTKAD